MILRVFVVNILFLKSFPLPPPQTTCESLDQSSMERTRLGAAWRSSGESVEHCFSLTGTRWASAFPLTTEATTGSRECAMRFRPPPNRRRLAGPLRKALKASRLWRQSTAPEMSWLSIYTISLGCIFLLRNLCFRLAGGKKELENQNKPIPTYVKVLLYVLLSYCHTHH